MRLRVGGGGGGGRGLWAKSILLIETQSPSTSVAFLLLEAIKKVKTLG